MMHHHKHHHSKTVIPGDNKVVAQIAGVVKEKELVKAKMSGAKMDKIHGVVKAETLGVEVVVVVDGAYGISLGNEQMIKYATILISTFGCCYGRFMPTTKQPLTVGLNSPRLTRSRDSEIHENVSAYI